MQAIKNPLEVCFAKERQKFSAAHFTIFEDGSVERLHGHNYHVTVRLWAAQLKLGLVFPFHLVKHQINTLCDAWDEYVMLPKQCPWFDIGSDQGQVTAHLKTPAGIDKSYSFPSEDVLIFDCDNISSENLALLFGDDLRGRLQAIPDLELHRIAVTISESSGQSVTTSIDL